MIDQLIGHRDSVSYMIAAFAIIMATILGYMFGYQDPAQMCSMYIVEAERTTNQALKCNQELTACRATKAGGAVIDCGPMCTQRVEKALRDHKAIVCED
tara:strand:- start:474 stop:770 length:297 start_codon:yes stop_codon:yes gene_type:complete